MEQTAKEEWSRVLPTIFVTEDDQRRLILRKVDGVVELFQVELLTNSSIKIEGSHDSFWDRLADEHPWRPSADPMLVAALAEKATPPLASAIETGIFLRGIGLSVAFFVVTSFTIAAAMNSLRAMADILDGTATSLLSKAGLLAWSGSIPVLTVLLAISAFIGIVISVNHIIRLKRRRTSGAVLRAALSEFRVSGDADAFVRNVSAVDTSEARVLISSLSAQKRDSVDDIESITDDSANAEYNRLRKSITFLAVVGATAPFIGLLGTVFDIITALHNIAMGGAENPANVMVAISQSLVFTGLGLFVAIPSVILYNYLQTVLEHDHRQIRELVRQTI